MSDKGKRSAVMAHQVLVHYLSFTVIEMRLNFIEFYFFYYQAVTFEHPKVMQSMFWIISSLNSWALEEKSWEVGLTQWPQTPFHC